MGVPLVLVAVAAPLAVAVTLGGPAYAASRGIEVAIEAGAAPGAAVVQTVRLYGASCPSVIGIDEYTFGWPRLSNGVNDARAVAAELGGSRKRRPAS